MDKKVKHHKKQKRKEPHSRIKSENALTRRSDDDGVLIFQYDLYKPVKIIKKLTRHLADHFTKKEHHEECKAWGLKV